jgi:hypothetical protein
MSTSGFSLSCNCNLRVDLGIALFPHAKLPQFWCRLWSIK